MKVKRITEILRRIWLFSANKIKSSESFSKQPTQLIVELNSSLRHIIVTYGLYKIGINVYDQFCWPWITQLWTTLALMLKAQNFQFWKVWIGTMLIYQLYQLKWIMLETYLKAQYIYVDSKHLLTLRFFFKFVSRANSSNIFPPTKWPRKQKM